MTFTHLTNATSGVAGLQKEIIDLREANARLIKMLERIEDSGQGECPCRILARKAIAVAETGKERGG